MITAKDLSELAALKNEVVILSEQRDRIRKDYAEVCREHPTTYDTVQGSSADWPYCLHTMSVEGVAKDVDSARTQTRKALAATISNLWTAQARAARKQQEIVEFISSVDDSRMRQILTLRCVEGLHWPDVAAKMGAAESEDSVKQACCRFLKKF